MLGGIKSTVRIVRAIVGSAVRGSCDAPLQIRVGRPIHLSHAAPANLGGQFIRAEARAEGEGQTFPYRSRTAARSGLFLLNDMTLSGVTRRACARIELDVRSPGHFR